MTQQFTYLQEFSTKSGRRARFLAEKPEDAGSDLPLLFFVDGLGVLSYSREGSCYGVCNGDLAIDFTQSTPAKVVVIDGVRYVPEVTDA